MPKREARHRRESKSNAAPARVGAAPGGRRVPAPAEPQAPRLARGKGEPHEVASLGPRSTPMRLAAEVERLKRELAAACTRMAALEARADIDPLTDVLNRRGFERVLNRSLAYVKRYGPSAALLYLDLDGFKSVNDRYGHAAGDVVLKAVAMVITRHVRASDVVARLGGDEFAVLLWNIGEVDACKKALTIEAALTHTTAMHAGATLSIAASAGAALLLPLDTPADVLERADRAMYARKAARNQPAGTRNPDSEVCDR
jgi:diguanylate cyclase (GGDEF)-like protein